ncbi:rho guanine nucleotide exchange factor 19 [Cebidichthys violaceus]|uniref:rho guanine nucleotide exchange factor 19 n=1 Tax=Cebidichthys violaceus TaxID=271503 RepID=UPI0035CB4D6D
MAQFDGTNENSRCLKSSSITNPRSYFGDSPTVNNLISQIQTMRTKEAQSNSAQDCGGLGESSGSVKQLEVCSPPTDMSSALRSIALMPKLYLKEILSPHRIKLFSGPGLKEDDHILSPLDDQDKSTDGATDPAEEEELSVSFQSKLIHRFPLYQDYFRQALNDVFDKTFESGRPQQHLSGVQSQFAAQCFSVAASLQLHPREATQSPPSPQPVRATPCTLWQDLEEVKKSGLLGILTTKEIRLQESMFELIGSEASYLRSLGVAVNHFYASKALKRTLTQMEHHILFSNIRRVMAVSEKFFIDLEIRLREGVLLSQVGDIVLQHCSKFHSLYGPYVTNMMYQERLLSHLLQQNRDFLNSLEKLESDPVCQRQSLKSFIVLPFQRITRIKLILESILKLTEPDSDSSSNLQKAIEAIHEMVTECNNRVRKMKQIEELVCLEMLLDFGKVKLVPLVVSGRFLVHQGPMRQLTVEATYRPRMSFMSIYLHLLNDLLIISSKKAPMFTVMDHASASHVHVQHLKAEVLGLPPNSFLLHLSQSHTGQPTAMILVANTRSDKEEWMKALSSKP